MNYIIGTNYWLNMKTNVVIRKQDNVGNILPELPQKGPTS